VKSRVKKVARAGLKGNQSLRNMYFYGLRGRQTQGPPRAANTLATPLIMSCTAHEMSYLRFCYKVQLVKCTEFQ